MGYHRAVRHSSKECQISINVRRDQRTEINSGINNRSQLLSRLRSEDQVAPRPANNRIAALQTHKRGPAIIADDQVGSRIAITARRIPCKNQVLHIRRIGQNVIHAAYHRVDPACEALHNNHIAVAHLIAVVARSAD